MLPHEFDIDQERCEQQDAIAEQLYIDGFSDAMDGIPPQSEDEAYQLGYAQGTFHLHSEHQVNRVCGNYNPCHSNEWLEDYGEF
jgi:hypothetical protein